MRYNPARYAAATLIVAAIMSWGIGLTACAHVTPPPQLSPIGDTAFYAHRVIQAVGSLQQAAIDGEKAGALTTSDARQIVNTTQTAAKAGSQLAGILATGDASRDSAQAKVNLIAIIHKALQELPGNLSAHGKEIVQPYINLINTFLTVFE